jgi:histidyl-tRNA synthetase
METNPLRVLDCKQEGCIAATVSAPASADHLCEECAAHFARVKAGLDAFGESWEIDNRMVRGLDYYNRTTFELLATDPASGVGSQNAIAGGGRYDGLVGVLGGRPTPAVGFAIGVERLRMLVDPGTAAAAARGVFVMTGGKGTLQAATALALGIRGEGIPVEFEGSEKGFKAKFKRADKCGAAVTVIVGEDEAARGACSVKSMTDAMLPGDVKQIEVSLNDAVRFIKSVMGR